MSVVSSSGNVYFLTVTILPQKEGLNVPKLLRKVSSVLADNSTATKIIHKLKVSGEAKIVSIIQVFNIIALERTVGELWQLGPVDVDCQPIIFYESFAKNMKIADELCQKNSCSVQKEGLYWLEFSIEYHGQTFDDFLAIWKKEAETVLTLRSKGETNIELFKCIAQRRVHVLLNATDPAQLDLLSLQLPIMKENGANILIKSKGVQDLDDYAARISQE